VGVRSHKHLDAWRVADELRREIYELFSEGRAARDQRLRSQAEDAASSACRNLAEGFTRFNPSEFAHYARIAAASVQEIGELLSDGSGRKYWAEERVQGAEALVGRAVKVIGGLQRYLRSRCARDNANEILRADEARRDRVRGSGRNTGSRQRE
jgi:four helix bundle protein